MIRDDGSAVLVGSTNGEWANPSAGSWDFAVVILDAGGTELWRWQVTWALPVFVLCRAHVEDFATMDM